MYVITMTHIILTGTRCLGCEERQQQHSQGVWTHSLPAGASFLLKSLQYRFGEEANMLQPSHEDTGTWEGASRETRSGICETVCFLYRSLVSDKEV